jgi:hypothetical protein
MSRRRRRGHGSTQRACHGRARASCRPGRRSLAAVLGIPQSTVQLYVPLLLPFGLELGGFIFLAAGLAPRRYEVAGEPIAAPVAKTSETVAKIKADAVATPAKRGTAAYYLERLQRDHPTIAVGVAAGELSIYKACIAAGIRKAPVKMSKWSKPAAYMRNANVTA